MSTLLILLIFKCCEGCLWQCDTRCGGTTVLADCVRVCQLLPHVINQSQLEGDSAGRNDLLLGGRWSFHSSRICKSPGDNSTVTTWHWHVLCRRPPTWKLDHSSTAPSCLLSIYWCPLSSDFFPKNASLYLRYTLSPQSTCTSFSIAGFDGVLKCLLSPHQRCK